MTQIKFLKHLKILLLNFSLLMTSSAVFAQKKPSKDVDYDLSRLALPSETKNIGKSAGSVYYSPSIKGKVLIPVHFWGYFQRPGLHFVPVETSLLEGISYAGGPNPQARIDNVKLMRKDEAGKFDNKFFDLEKGGNNKAAMSTLRPGDMVFVERDYWQEDRAYYTGLIGVVATVLSSILLYREVKKNR